VLNRLKLVQKFLILGVVALIMIGVPTALYLAQSFQAVAVAQSEARGVAPLMAMQRVIQFSQQHRGLSSGMLSGNQAMRDRRPGVKDNVDKAIAAVDDALLMAGASSALSGEWAQRKDRWKALEQAVTSGQLSAADSTRQHTAFIKTLFQLNDLTMDEYGLSLDPHEATNALIRAAFIEAPWLTEKLGIMRAMGSGFLTQKVLPPQGRGTLMALRDSAEEFLEGMTGHVLQAGRADPLMQTALEAPVKAVREQVGQTVALADSQLINAAELTFVATEYFDNFTRSIDAVYQFNGTAMATLDAALQARLSELNRTLGVVVGVLALGLVLSVWLAVLFVRSVTVPVAQAVDLAEAVAGGDLTRQIPPHGSNEIGQLLEALGKMQTQLASLVRTVRADADGVATASSQIAQGNNDLSARTEQAASALEQTAAAMEQLSSHVQENAQHAREADTLAHSAREVAVKGGSVVSEVVHTMREINTSSSKIADIIGVIDSIAFQTNILALNAAVEAARAGEQGRGFAVVASEVRSLAGRSAEAAKEIKGLISASVERVHQGTALVDQAGQTMEEVVNAIKRVTEIMGDISAASAAQSTSVIEVGQAVSQMDQSTQQNAALVEEAAAAASSLNQEAAQLVRAVSVFKVLGGWPSRVT